MAKQDLANNDVLKINNNLSVETKLRLCGQFKLKEIQGVDKIIDISFAETEEQIQLLAVLGWQLDQKKPYQEFARKVMQLDISDLLEAMDKVFESLNAKLKNQSGPEKKVKAPRKNKKK